MKRIICLIITLCLVFGSFSFAFASPTVWDTSDQSNLLYIRNSLTSSTGTVVSALNTIITNTNTIANHLNTIKGYLVDSGHGVAYWVSAISTWMSPIYNSIQAIPVDLTSIKEGLWETLPNQSQKSYLLSIKETLANTNVTSLALARQNAHTGLFGGWTVNGTRYDGNLANSLFKYAFVQANGGATMFDQYWNNGTPLGNIAYLLWTLNNNNSNIYSYRWAADLTGYNSLQSLVSFADPDSTVTFTPQSATDGIYKYLNAINTPLARLGYVLASDSRIEAQEAAAANEQAVVDNFIDSSGPGSASPSDIGSISDLSSGYQSNFGSDASVSGIFNIFNSNNMGWFSQETANQLDTTTSSRRGSSFETPLLDQQINDIYDQIGIKHD